MKNKGFTLVELLAVIVVLAIIALIGYTTVGDIIQGVQESADKETIREYAKAVEQAKYSYLVSTGIDINREDTVISQTWIDANVEFSKAQVSCNRVSYLDGVQLNRCRVNNRTTTYCYENNNVYECGSDGSDDSTVPTLDELLGKYEFKYFNSLNDAVTAVNNGTIDESANGEQDVSPVGVYIDDSDIPCVVLLNDVTTDTTITPTVDMTINLGGNTLTSSSTVGIKLTSGNLTINGYLAGSEIVVGDDDNSSSGVVRSSGSSSVTVLGGTYITRSTSAGAVFTTSSRLEVSNATIRAYANTVAPDAKLSGIHMNPGSATSVTNCDIRVYANYSTSSYDIAGIYNFGILTLNDSYISGIYSGVVSSGVLFVNGGTYEGYGHGGFYLSGTETTSYIQNATIGENDMPAGYTDLGAGANGAAFYVGGASGMDNISVYMDSCKLYGSRRVLVLRGTSGEKYNKVYISNSTINTDTKIRIDNNTHHLYIGTGNNFTADNTTLPDAVTTTDETYVYGLDFDKTPWTVPEGGTYYVGVTSTALGDYTGATAIYTEGQMVPATAHTGDVFVLGDYEYRLNMSFSYRSLWETNTTTVGWGVRVLDSTQSSYGEILESICGMPVTSLRYTFAKCSSLTTAPAIPSSVTSMNSTFYNCTALTTAPAIPSSVTNMNSTFYNCTALTTAPAIPSSVTNMSDTFYNCTALTTAPVIPSSVTSMVRTFCRCSALKGNVEINAKPSRLSETFAKTIESITLTGSSTMLAEIAATATNGNVTVGS